MTALTDLSDVVNRMTGGNSGAPENLFFFKDARVGGAAAAATVAGRWSSLWQYAGSPSHGAAPGAVTAPGATTDGGIKQTDPAGGKQKWLLGGTASSLSAGTLVLYDRLVTISGLNGTTTTAQTVGGTLGRYTGTASVGNQIWIEIYTQIGASSTTVTSSYTDESGNSGSTTVATAIGNTGFREAQRIIPLPLAQGDSGVRAVATVTVLATTGTAGDFGVSIVRPLLYIPIGNVGCGSIRDMIAGLPGPIEIQTGACLAWAWLANGTTAPQIYGSLHVCEK